MPYPSLMYGMTMAVEVVAVVVVVVILMVKGVVV